MNNAKYFGKKILNNHYKRDNDAVMFDIDNTLIFYNEKPNIPIIELAKYTKKLNYKVIIITARPNYKENVKYTQIELDKYSIPYDLIIYCSHENKHNIKKKLSNRFVLSVGDLWTDVSNSLHYIKLPAPNETIENMCLK